MKIFCEIERAVSEGKSWVGVGEWQAESANFTQTRSTILNKTPPALNECANRPNLGDVIEGSI
jgi:hypothetical protein